MNVKIRTAFIVKTPAQRAQMISSARSYINNDQFLNLLQNVDINDVNVKNNTKPTSIYWITSQLAAFNAVPGLVTQVTKWLAAPS
jgi:hypothetical protein